MAAARLKTTHVLRVALQDSPGVWREVEVASSTSLYRSAEALVGAFGFAFDHAFGFYADLGEGFLRAQPRYELFADMGERENSLSVRNTSVAEAVREVGQTLLLLFDYGDDWRFVVTLVGMGERVPRRRYPRVLRSEGKSPEQYAAWDEESEDEDKDDPKSKGLH